MKKYVAILSALTMAVSSCAFSAAADEVSKVLAGDVNNDGVITALDLVMLSKYLLGSDNNISNQDVNNDGETNVLDLITMKKLLLGDTPVNQYSVKEIQADKTENGILDYSYSFNDQINEEIAKTATYVDSYEKMTSFMSDLSEYKIFTDSLKEKYNEEFFKQRSVVFYFSSTLHICGELESLTVEDGKLSVNVFDYEQSLPLPVISYVASEFTKDAVSSYNIKSAEYRSPVRHTFGPDSGLDQYTSNIHISEKTGWYKWIDSSEELNDLLDYDSVHYIDDDSRDNISYRYDSEFFKTNRLLVYNGYVDCVEVSASSDENMIHLSILADQTDSTQLLFIGIPSEIGKDKKTIINCRYRNVPLKPAIYLYPQKETEVSVSVDLNGRFSCVYPEFTDKENNMWKVTASPDGLLRAEDGSEYNYLFWEGIQDVQWDMSEGFVVKGSDTLSFLRDQLPKMGLTPKEYNDFIVYWLPQMQNNEYNYITFQTDKYTDNAVLKVTPDADSVLRVFMAYTPVNKEEAQILSQSVKEPEFNGFERNGFTVVEWGGCNIKK